MPDAEHWPESITAAYVVLVLQDRGLLSRAEARTAAEVLRLHADDVVAAEQRSIKRPHLKIRFRQKAEKESGPRATRRKTGGVPPNRRNGPDGPERRCTRCKKWLPATFEQFGFSDAKNRRLRSWCRPCWNDYQRERYLTRAQQEALANADLVFVLEEDQTLIACAKCGGALRAGQEVTGKTSILHVACGDGPFMDGVNARLAIGELD